MVLFKVSKKTHVEKPGDVHQFKVEFRSKEGHKLTLDIGESEFEDYQTGDQIDVKWGNFQRGLEDFNR